MADYGNFKRQSYRVKKPIRSFKDLEVYYRTEQASVRIIKDVMPHLADGKCPEKLKDQLLTCGLRIPQMIAESHSKRFDDKTLALKMLDEAKHACNTVVVYLEQVRDVSMGTVSKAPNPPAEAPAAPSVPPMVTACNEIIREYAFTRVKILNLLKAWLKFEDNLRGPRAPGGGVSGDDPQSGGADEGTADPDRPAEKGSGGVEEAEGIGKRGEQAGHRGCGAEESGAMNGMRFRVRMQRKFDAGVSRW